MLNNLLDGSEWSPMLDASLGLLPQPLQKFGDFSTNFFPQQNIPQFFFKQNALQAQ